MKNKKIYYHVLEYGNYESIGHQGCYDTEPEAKEEAKRLAEYFPNLYFEIFPSTSRKEPPITTV